MQKSGRKVTDVQHHSWLQNMQYTTNTKNAHNTFTHKSIEFEPWLRKTQFFSKKQPTWVFFFEKKKSFLKKTRFCFFLKKT